jgi:hypothetical protein
MSQKSHRGVNRKARVESCHVKPVAFVDKEKELLIAGSVVRIRCLKNQLNHCIRLETQVVVRVVDQRLACAVEELVHSRAAVLGTRVVRQ